MSGRFLHKEREVSVCLPVSRVTLEATRKLATDKAGAALSLSLLGSATLSSSPGAPSTILLPFGSEECSIGGRKRGDRSWIVGSHAHRPCIHSTQLFLSSCKAPMSGH